MNWRPLKTAMLYTGSVEEDHLVRRSTSNAFSWLSLGSELGWSVSKEARKPRELPAATRVKKPLNSSTMLEVRSESKWIAMAMVTEPVVGRVWIGRETRRYSADSETELQGVLSSTVSGRFALKTSWPFTYTM